MLLTFFPSGKLAEIVFSHFAEQFAFFFAFQVLRAIDFQLNIQRCSKASTEHQNTQNIWINCQRGVKFARIAGRMKNEK